MKHGTKKLFSKTDGWVVSITFLLLSLLFFVQSLLSGLIDSQQLLALHLVIELIIVICAFSISFQAWTQFPHTRSSQQLWFGSLFFFIGFMELFQANTYSGMPFFQIDDPTYQPTWFYMVSRLVVAAGLLFVLLPKDRQVDLQHRWYAYSLALIYTLIWGILVFSPAQQLPNLFIAGSGNSLLKDSLHLLAILIQIVVVILLFKRRQSSSHHLFVTIASIHFVIGDAIFILYPIMMDINCVIGRSFQLAGFYFLVRAFYRPWTEEPFQKQKAAEHQLRKSEGFLNTLVSHMQEGILVIDTQERLTFCNPKAEQLLQWSANELIGREFGQLVRHYTHNCDSCQYECTTLPMSCYQQMNVLKEEYFVRKDGTIFPVSYTRTPMLDDGQRVGSIIVFGDITQQKKDQEYIAYMAYHDELTKLPNSRYFAERLEELLALNPDKNRAVILLDIDRFKTMNDTLGHAHGDLILESVALRLREALPPKLFLGRMRGNQFALLLPVFKSREDIAEVCQQIQHILSEPFFIQHVGLKVTMNMGIAISPEHGSNPAELCKHAQIAMHEAQKEVHRYKFYHNQMDQKLLERLLLEHDLHHALDKEEFHLYYQPQTDLRTGHILSFEALIRWKHPRHGWVSPIDFIPIAEETGLIVPIGEWVLKTACKQLKAWHEQGLDQIGVSVNLSTRQFFQQNLVDTIKRVLDETALSAKYLELEITESMTINESHAIEILQNIKQLGVKIAVDDFGTGYSSLYYLKELPLDRLKIDQSFVRDMMKDKHHAAIISMIVSIAQQLQIEVIAEGVENMEQLTFLWSHHCRQGQGYLFSPPIPAEEVSKRFEDIQERTISYSNTLHIVSSFS